ncbi:MAG: cytochrome c biogenesis protein CcsA [Acidimicrobiia bacterium]|nr:cytochrome c biogenesis protein CcsA [Acidimicrobiia bacterium]
MTVTTQDQRRGVLDVAAIVAIAAAVLVAFATPPEATQGNVARLFNIHVPSILVAYLCFGLTLIGGTAYLVTRRLRFDHLAVAAAEVGVVFTGLTMLVGMIWAKPIWGVYWTWSARLILTAVMFFGYLGYLALRRAIDDPIARARRAAVFGIISIGIIPIVHFSVLWWRDVHQPPTLLRPDEMQIDGPLLAAFLAGLVASTLVAAALIVRRYRLAAREAELDSLLASADVPVAGDAVTAPTLDGAP